MKKQSGTGEQLYDLERIRRDARQSVERGAVTEDYQLDLDKAYALLNEALATEIMCVLRYRHHQIVASGIDYPQVAAEFAEHADAEAQHMMRIAERINQLGGDPEFDPHTVAVRSSTEYGAGGSLETMIRDDLISERVAIEIYRRLIEWFGAADPTTRRMLEEILENEEEHANDLATLLERMGPQPAAPMH